jgi:toxin ParE1/3/4
MRCKIRNAAQNDIEETWYYTFKNWSLEQADRYYHLILDEIDYLSQNPKSGKNYSHIRKDYFRSKVKSRFIFYKVTLEEIEIIKILHQEMDIDDRLND